METLSGCFKILKEMYSSLGEEVASDNDAIGESSSLCTLAFLNL